MNKLRVAIIASVLVGAGVFATAALAKSNHDDNTRPGWGFGDKNHKHTGPPGHSVRPGKSVHPGHDNDNDDDQGEDHDHGNGHGDDD